MEDTRLSLLLRVRDPHDQESWQEFFELYHPLLINFVRAKGIDDRTSADDVVQEILISLSRRLPEFDLDKQRGRFRTYLWQTAHNAVATWFRRNARRLQMAELDRESVICQLEQQSQSEPNRDFIKALRKRVLEQAMTRIKASSRPETWECFRLHILDHIPAKQVAATLGRTESSVFVNAARVVERLRGLCAQYLEELGNGVE